MRSNDAHRVLGEILTKQREWDAALSNIELAIALAQDNENSYLAGYGWRALGKFHAARRQLEESIAAYDESIRWFNAINLPNERAISKKLRDMIQL